LPVKHSLPASSPIGCLSGEPRSCLRAWRSQLAEQRGLLLVDFELPRYWLAGGGTQPLTALYHLSADGLQVAVTDRALVADGSSPEPQFQRWVRELQLVSYREGQPLQCLPHAVPKPWGREIW
jgi:hypothetical protein